MDLDAVSRVYSRTPAAPAEPAPHNPPDGHEARDERAAILEFEAGISRETADARAAQLHPLPSAAAPAVEPEAPWYGFTPADLLAAAGMADWPEIAERPAALEALAFLLHTRAQRDRGECPPHYSQAAECANCGPVLLWAGAPARLIACPWCLATRSGATIPRPEAASSETAGDGSGLGDCLAKARASREPETLWPGATLDCRSYRAAGK